MSNLFHSAEAIADCLPPELAIVAEHSLPCVPFRQADQPSPHWLWGDTAPLPTDTPWPRVDGKALVPHGVIDLEWLPNLGTWVSQPASGLLLFFVDVETAACQVMYTAEPGPEQSCPQEPGEGEWRLDRTFVTAGLELWTVPPLISANTELLLGPDLCSRYEMADLDAARAPRIPWGIVQFLGHPIPWQQSPTDGDDIVLLAELDGGGGGSYFYTITAAALEEHDFSDVYCEFQCS